MPKQEKKCNIDTEKKRKREKKAEMQRWLWKDKEIFEEKIKCSAYLMPLRVGLTGKNPKTKKMSPVICSRAERKQAATHFFNMARGK